MHDLNPFCEIRKSNRTIQVLQFYVHCISAKYHSVKLHTHEGETFGSLDFFNWPLESHVTGNHRNAQPNIFLESIIVACINFSNISLKEAKL